MLGMSGKHPDMYAELDFGLVWFDSISYLVLPWLPAFAATETA